MKFIVKILAGILGLYVLLCAALVLYFSQSAGHGELLESALSRVFKRVVTIEEVHTNWNGISPQIQIKNLIVAGDFEDSPALSFHSLTAELDGASIFRFWPMFSEFAIDRPSLEIVSLSASQIQIAGIPLKPREGNRLNPQSLASWLLNHKSLVWHDGDVIWRRLNGEVQKYSNISFVYHREQQNREVRATTTGKGQLAFVAKASGEIISSDGWNASLEILGQHGKRLLAPQDLSLTVENGAGQLTLKTLNVSRIRDFLRLSGLGSENNWLLRSQLQGRLHDVVFDFSGPLLALHDWSLKANASDISFSSVSPAPAMNNLSGQLVADREGGQFQFATSDASFDWPRWFNSPFEISQSSGEMHWTIDPSGKIKLRLLDALLTDPVFSIKNLNASIELDTRSRNVTTFGELFKLESISDLSYEDGKVVDSKQAESNGLKPLFLDMSLNFSAQDMTQVTQYLPNDRRLDKLRAWWSGAFTSGEVYDGHLSYQGEVSKNAIYVGKAELLGHAQYKNVEIDYGFQQNWPVLRKGKGHVTLRDDVLSFEPSEAWLGNDRLIEPKVAIHSLFKLDRRLDLSAGMKTSLDTVTQFLIDGPLIKQGSKSTEKKTPVAIKVKQGTVDAKLNVSVPLRRVSMATVEGVARISSGAVEVSPSMAVTNVSALVDFTEQSATSENIRGDFLGHPVQARLQTTKEAKPPDLKLSANGHLDVPELIPWIGEHLASVFTGSTAWQGELIYVGKGLSIEARSDLVGVEVLAPAPLAKPAQNRKQMSVSMQLGGSSNMQKLSVSAGDDLSVQFASEPSKGVELLQKSLIRVGATAVAQPLVSELDDGVHFDVQHEQLDFDDWLSAIIDLTRLKTTQELSEPVFLDAMRSVKIESPQLNFMGRNFGDVSMSALTADGYSWVGTISGDRLTGTLRAEPRAQTSDYSLRLSRFHLPDLPGVPEALTPVDSSLAPSDYPVVELIVDSFKMGQKHLGNLEVRGEPTAQSWNLSHFSLTDKGINTSAEGQWVNNDTQGTVSTFRYQTVIDEAGDVLDGMDFGGVLKRGQGTLNGQVTWIGAPHEFEYGRLNGDFDLRIQNGELVKVEPGGGKLLGLLNFNAFARRLTLDFTDVFSTGLSFDRMRLAGVLADGEAIMRDAYVFSPAVFIQMEGKLDLNKELIDMDVYLSPELGGNLTLLSALANPAAGAVVFITQQLFKDEMRASSLRGYRALGSWEDFELEELGRGTQNTTKKNSELQTNNEETVD